MTPPTRPGRWIWAVAHLLTYPQVWAVIPLPADVMAVALLLPQLGQNNKQSSWNRNQNQNQMERQAEDEEDEETQGETTESARLTAAAAGATGQWATVQFWPVDWQRVNSDYCCGRWPSQLKWALWLKKFPKWKITAQCRRANDCIAIATVVA